MEKQEQLLLDYVKYIVLSPFYQRLRTPLIEEEWSLAREIIRCESHLAQIRREYAVSISFLETAGEQNADMGIFFLRCLEKEKEEINGLIQKVKDQPNHRHFFWHSLYEEKPESPYYNADVFRLSTLLTQAKLLWPEYVEIAENGLNTMLYWASETVCSFDEAVAWAKTVLYNTFREEENKVHFPLC